MWSSNKPPEAPEQRVEYRYLLLRSDGQCLPLYRQAQAAQGAAEGTMRPPTRESLAAAEVIDLQPATPTLAQLLIQGWQPIRETGLGDGTALMLLERPAS